MGLLKRNFLYQSLYQVLIIFLPIFTAPYVARTLGVENSGIFSYTNVIANYFVLFGMLGLEQYGARCIASVRGNYDEMCIMFSELFLLHGLLSVIVILFYFFYCFMFVSDYIAIFLLQGFYIIGVLFNINWFFFGIEKFKFTVVRNTIIKILSVFSIFLFVKTKEDLPVYTFILSFSYFLTQITIWPLLKKHVEFKRIPFSSIKKHWKPLFVLFIAVLAANVNRMIDQAMLGWFDKISELGCYAYADKIIRIPLSFIVAIDTVMLSRMSYLFSQKDKETIGRNLDTSACLVLLFSIGMGFGIVAVAPEFVVWFLGEEFKESTNLLSVLAFSIPLVGWNNYVRTQILIPNQMDSVYSKAVCIGAIVNVVLNSFIIQIMGARGAAITTVISYAVITIIQTLSVSYIINNFIECFKYVLFPLFAGSIMYLMIRLCAGFTNHLFISVCLELFVGAVVYIILTIIYLKFKKPMILKAIFK